jgi:hypothetical protein
MDNNALTMDLVVAPACITTVPGTTQMSSTTSLLLKKVTGVYIYIYVYISWLIIVEVRVEVRLGGVK